MKKRTVIYLLLSILGISINAFAQSDIRLRTKYGSENQDLMSVLQFEEIGFDKLIFTGNDLKNKDFQISIKKIVGGRLEKQDVVFDSKESDYFKIKSDQFVFRLLTKETPELKARFDFQFNGFSKQMEYVVEKNNNDLHRKFALKDFLGDKPDMPISVDKNTYILAYMMPYVRPDGSSSYCEVAQSGVNPEELGSKYAIPTYFLIDIKFQ